MGMYLSVLIEKEAGRVGKAHPAFKKRRNELC